MDQQRKSTFSLHLDLVLDILSRLPEKSVVRFRCVSKLWLAIAIYPYFIKLFGTRKPNLLICFKEDDELVFSSIEQHFLTFDRKSYSESHRYRMKFPKFINFVQPTESVHGLICFGESGTPIIWNPSTKELLTLPKPSEIWKSINVGLGYDPVEGKHKVIAMPIDRPFGIWRVLTLGSAQESWRSVKINQKDVTYFSACSGKYINGVIYYRVCIDRTYPCVFSIMRFDVRSEKFDLIQLPSYVNVNVGDLLSYEGRLACVQDRYKGITLWILENAEENKWLSKDFRAPYSFYDFQKRFQLKDFTHAGEFVYEPVPYVASESLSVIFYHPMRNSFRRFGLNRTGDNEEQRYILHIFPNHFETQTSL